MYEKEIKEKLSGNGTFWTRKALYDSNSTPSNRSPSRAGVFVSHEVVKRLLSLSGLNKITHKNKINSNAYIRDCGNEVK
jgi:hypothetical protein